MVTQSGKCAQTLENLVNDNSPINLYVTGMRDDENTHPNYSNLLEALNSGFRLAYNSINSTVNIFLNPEVEHAILLRDLKF